MQARDAIALAKEWIRDVHGEEKPSNIGLEEVRKDGELWKITIGFSRPWDENRGLGVVLQNLPPHTRTYKVVTVNDADGIVLSSENREPGK